MPTENPVIFYLELKPVQDPLARRTGTHRSATARLKRLLKYARRECGLVARWGQQPPPIPLTDQEPGEDP